MKFVGYDENAKGYRLVNAYGQIRISREVRFLENTPEPHKDNDFEWIVYGNSNEEAEEIFDEQPKHELDDTHDKEDDTHSEEEDFYSQEEDTQQEEFRWKTLNERKFRRKLLRHVAHKDRPDRRSLFNTHIICILQLTRRNHAAIRKR